MPQWTPYEYPRTEVRYADGNQDIGQAYLDWLAQRLGFTREELEKTGVGAWWGGVWGPLNERQQIWQQAKQAVASGNLMAAPYFFGGTDSFYAIYSQYQKLYPEQELPFAGQEIAPGLYIQPDGTFTDDQGRPVSQELAQRQLAEYWAIPETELEGLTPYQQAQLALQREQLGLSREELEWQKQQQLLEWGAQPRNWIQYWMATNLPQGVQRPAEGFWERPFWEEPRNWREAYGELTPQERAAFLYLNPMGEATRARFEAGYGFGPSQAQEYQQRLQEARGGYLEVPPENLAEFYGAQELARWTGQPTPTSYIPPSPMALGEYPIEPITGQEAWALYRQSPGYLAAEKEADRYYAALAAAQAGPPAPAWLPQFVPGLVAGQPIAAGGIMPTKTPSGQMWSALPWSQQQGLGGYADWAAGLGGGRVWEDIMSEMEMMRPVTPYTGGGYYGGFRPARQWA